MSAPDGSPALRHNDHGHAARRRQPGEHRVLVSHRAHASNVNPRSLASQALEVGEGRGSRRPSGIRKQARLEICNRNRAGPPPRAANGCRISNPTPPSPGPRATRVSVRAGTFPAAPPPTREIKSMNAPTGGTLPV